MFLNTNPLKELSLAEEIERIKRQINIIRQSTICNNRRS